jgi:hypothetical protein
MSANVVNNHLIHVCSPQRSGHHAVIQWILANANMLVLRDPFNLPAPIFGHLPGTEELRP